MSFFHKKPSKFCDALLFFVIGIVLLVTSSRITCFLGECILITSGSGFDAKGVRFSSGDVTLIQTVAIVMFIIAMIFLIIGIIDYNKAEGRIPVSKQAPNNPLLEEAKKHFNLGNQHFDINNYHEAISCYHEAIKTNPRYIQAYIKRGLVRQKIQDYENAIIDYGKAIQISPRNSDAYYNRGIALLYLNEFEEAIEDFSEVIDIGQINPLVYKYRASAYFELGNYLSAIEDYSKAIQLDPQQAILYSDRADAYIYLDNKRAAISDYKKAVLIYNKQDNQERCADLMDLINELEIEYKLEISDKSKTD
jgi:tetratricopeptide (TPR) repeat protein